MNNLLFSDLDLTAQLPEGTGEPVSILVEYRPAPHIQEQLRAAARAAKTPAREASAVQTTVVREIVSSHRSVQALQELMKASQEKGEPLGLSVSRLLHYSGMQLRGEAGSQELRAVFHVLFGAPGEAGQELSVTEEEAVKYGVIRPAKRGNA